METFWYRLSQVHLEKCPLSRKESETGRAIKTEGKRQEEEQQEKQEQEEKGPEKAVTSDCSQLLTLQKPNRTLPWTVNRGCCIRASLITSM